MRASMCACMWLCMCGSGTEAFRLQAQCRWIGHVMRMTHGLPSRYFVDNWLGVSNYQKDATSAIRKAWNKTWWPVEYHRINLTVLRLPEHHNDLIVSMTSTTSRPLVLVLYRRSGKLRKQPQSGHRDSGRHCCGHVYESWIGLYTHSTANDKIHQWWRLTPCACGCDWCNWDLRWWQSGFCPVSKCLAREN